MLITNETGRTNDLFNSTMWKELLKAAMNGDVRSLARCISFVENGVTGYEFMMQELPVKTGVIIGITGPPGAGKSTLTDALIGEMIKEGKRVAVLCVDPSSPFNLGALLGDRIRMSSWYNNPNVYIRSLATRGSLGGLHPRILEISDLVRSAGFDYVLIETVGVGQSEIEISALADITLVVLVPESGDDIQSMKAGLMEIADIFVVNKSDRPGSDQFMHNLKSMLSPAFSKRNIEPPVIKTIATAREGVNELLREIEVHSKSSGESDKRTHLLTEKAYSLIRDYRMKDVNKIDLFNKIKTTHVRNIYQFIQQWLPK